MRSHRETPHTRPWDEHLSPWEQVSCTRSHRGAPHARLWDERVGTRWGWPEGSGSSGSGRGERAAAAPDLTRPVEPPRKRRNRLEPGEPPGCPGTALSSSTGGTRLGGGRFPNPPVSLGSARDHGAGWAGGTFRGDVSHEQRHRHQLRSLRARCVPGMVHPGLSGLPGCHRPPLGRPGARWDH